MKPYVCVVGAVNLDICGRPEKKLIFRDSNPGAVTLTPGGVGRNIAHDLRLLGVEVKFLTAFGGDSHAQLLRNDCVELGMDLSCALDVPDGRTSTYLYITDERGEMQLGLCDTDISAAITPAYLQRHLDVLNSAAAVVLDGNLTAETITWLGTHCSAPLFADPVSVTKAERMRAALGALHTFKPNLTEGQNLTGESTPEGIVAALLAQGVQRVFLSMGADGILAGTRAELVHLPCLPTCMVNTTGGGDAVMAALVWAYLQGLDLRESAAAALRAGKATVEYPGTNNPDAVHGDAYVVIDIIKRRQETDSNGMPVSIGKADIERTLQAAGRCTICFFCITHHKTQFAVTDRDRHIFTGGGQCIGTGTKEQTIG